MWNRRRNSAVAKQVAFAPLFAALGDETRLRLVASLCDGQARSISELTQGTRLTRQAVTKHLRLLEGVGIVRNVRSGRESLFAVELETIESIQQYLDQVSAQWEGALSRLKVFVED